MKFSLPVGHNCKHLKSTSVRHLIALFEITTRSHHWATAQTREWGSRSNLASDSVRSGPTNYEDSTPEWASDTFAYRSPNKNPFLRFAYPRVKKEKKELIIILVNNCNRETRWFCLPSSPASFWTTPQHYFLLKQEDEVCICAIADAVLQFSSECWSRWVHCTVVKREFIVV